MSGKIELESGIRIKEKIWSGLVATTAEKQLVERELKVYKPADPNHTVLSVPPEGLDEDLLLEWARENGWPAVRLEARAYRNGNYAGSFTLPRQIQVDQVEEDQAQTALVPGPKAGPVERFFNLMVDDPKSATRTLKELEPAVDILQKWLQPYVDAAVDLTKEGVRSLANAAVESARQEVRKEAATQAEQEPAAGA